MPPAVSDRLSNARRGVNFPASRHFSPRILTASVLAAVFTIFVAASAQAERTTIETGARILAAAVAADIRGCAGPADGAASWYGKRFQGRTTASGTPFDMYAMTAAHRTLPLGSRIRVTNRTSGKAVLLTVNDRGPYIDGRMLDVSYAAARELGFVRKGLAKVRVETLSC